MNQVTRKDYVVMKRGWNRANVPFACLIFPTGHEEDRDLP